MIAGSIDINPRSDRMYSLSDLRIHLPVRISWGLRGHRRKGTYVLSVDEPQYDGRSEEEVRWARYIESIDSEQENTRTDHYRKQRSHSQTFRLHVSSNSPAGRLPPKRKSSFLRVLAVSVALLLRLGGSEHSSSVTFMSASC